MPHRFPFRIQGFHCDNGSEFINHTVARLPNKLLIEFTKSRAYRTTENALVEGKNGAIIRKHIGYGPIPGYTMPAGLNVSLPRSLAGAAAGPNNTANFAPASNTTLTEPTNPAGLQARLD